MEIKSEGKKLIEKNWSWLEERWSRAEIERESPDRSLVPPWFYEPATDRQLERLKAEGMLIRYKNAALTKGQASDLIGLCSEPEEENLEVLRFFKVRTAGFNESRARHEVALLLSKPESRRAWDKRPATPWEREFYTFFELKCPKDLTSNDAKRAQREFFASLNEEDEWKIEAWSSYESIYEEIADPYFREDYAMRKPTIPQFRKAMEALVAAGHTFEKLQDELEVVIEKLIEMTPKLSKEE